MQAFLGVIVTFFLSLDACCHCCLLHLVTLTASSPSYFRGFTLIALKEGTEGDKDEDYAGTFQVSNFFTVIVTQKTDQQLISPALIVIS